MGALGKGDMGQAIGIGVVVLVGYLIITKRVSGTALITTIANSFVMIFWGVVGWAVISVGEGNERWLGLLPLGYAVFGLFNRLYLGEIWRGSPQRPTRPAAPPPASSRRPTPSASPTAALVEPLDDLSASVFELLVLNGRSDVGVLAHQTGSTPAMVRKSVQRLVHTGLALEVSNTECEAAS